MHAKYCEHMWYVALSTGYCDCFAISVGHQVFLVLGIMHCTLGIRSIVYWVLGHWVCIRCNLQGDRTIFYTDKTYKRLMRYPIPTA